MYDHVHQETDASLRVYGPAAFAFAWDRTVQFLGNDAPILGAIFLDEANELCVFFGCPVRTPPRNDSFGRGTLKFAHVFFAT